MRLSSIKKWVPGFILFLTFSCSKSQPEEAVQDQDSEGSSENATEGHPEGNQDSTASTNSLPTLPTTTENYSGQASPSPQIPNQELQSAVLGLQDEANRVVRFVLNDHADIHEQGNAQSKVVAQLNKGDPIVVVIHGEWAEISPHHFIKQSLLSHHVVPRKRLNTWNPFGNQLAAAPTKK